MANVPSSAANTVREDFEGLDTGVRQQYDMLRRALNLPEFHTLESVPQQEIAERIITQIFGIRGAVTKIGLLEEGEFVKDFQREYNKLGGDPNSRNETNYDYAEAILKTVYKRFSEEDLDGLIKNEVRIARIRTNNTANDSQWISKSLVNIGTPTLPCTVEIDLKHPIWESGDEKEIRKQLQGKFEYQAGIRFRNPGGGVMTYADIQLTAPDIDSIMKSECDVRDIHTPANIPTPAYRQMTLSDALNEQAPIQRLVKGTANKRELLLALSAIHDDPTLIGLLKGKDEAGEKQKELDQAKALKQDAETAEKIKKAEVPEYSFAEIGHARGVLTGILGNISAGKAAPNNVDVFIASDSPQATYRLFTPADKKVARAIGIPTHIVRRNDIVKGVRENNVNVLDEAEGKVYAALEKYDAAEKKFNNIRTTLGEIAALLTAKGVKEADINAKFPTLKKCLLDPTYPTVPAYAVQDAAIDKKLNLNVLYKEVKDAIRDYAADDRKATLKDSAAYDTDIERLTGEVEEAKKKGVEKGALGSEACWAIIRENLERKRITGTRLDKTISYMRAQTERTGDAVKMIDEFTDEAFPRESDDELENHKIRENLNSSHKKWNKLSGFRYATLVFAKKYDGYSDYKKNLFKRDKTAIGLELNDNLANHSNLQTVIDAYFRVKYLRDLPEDNPLFLPKEDPDIKRFLRRAHKAIIERAQLAFGATSGTSSEDLRTLKADVLKEADEKKVAKPGIEDRMRAVHAFLTGNTYLENPKNASKVKEVGEAAYKPIKTKLDRHNWWTGGIKNRIGNVVKGDGRWWNPLSWPSRRLQNLTGAGSGWNPLTWPGKTVRFAGGTAIPYVWNNKVPIVGASAAGAAAGVGAAYGISALLGTAVAPGIGTAIGVGVGAAAGLVMPDKVRNLWKWFTTVPSKTGGAPAGPGR